MCSLYYLDPTCFGIVAIIMEFRPRFHPNLQQYIIMYGMIILSQNDPPVRYVSGAHLTTYVNVITNYIFERCVTPSAGHMLLENVPFRRLYILQYSLLYTKQGLLLWRACARICFNIHTLRVQ